MTTCYTPDVSMFPYYPRQQQDLKKQVQDLQNEIIWEWNEQVIGLKETIEELKHENLVLKNDNNTMKDEYNEIKELYADRDRVKKLNQELNTQIKNVRKQMEDTEKLNTKLNDEIVVCRKEVHTIKDAIENECEASGIMEIMNTRIENAEDMHKKVLETYYIEKNMNKYHVAKINKLQEVLCIKFNKQSCAECEEWFDMTEIEDVNDSDYDRIDVCVNCRDNGYTQCDECMEYCCDSLIIVNGNQEEICSQCYED